MDQQLGCLQVFFTCPFYNRWIHLQFHQVGPSDSENSVAHLRIRFLLQFQTDIPSWISQGFAVVLKRASSSGRWCGYMSWNTWNKTIEALLSLKHSCESEFNLDANLKYDFSLCPFSLIYLMCYCVPGQFFSEHRLHHTIFCIWHSDICFHCRWRNLFPGPGKNNYFEALTFMLLAL